MLVLSRFVGQAIRIRTQGSGDIWVAMSRDGLDLSFVGGEFHAVSIPESKGAGGYDITDQSGGVTIIRRLKPLPPYRSYRVGITAPAEYDIKREELIDR